jgi:hypothetical protein
MNKLTHSLLKSVPKEDWIMQSSHLPWLQLHLSVPVEKILTEANAIYPLSVSHRSKDEFLNYHHQGWKSLSIFGESPTITERTNGTLGWTSIADQCPDTVEFINEHWQIDENTGRIRFMWLEPGGYILPHQDRPEPGFFETNVAISHPDDCVFRFLNYGNVPFKSGSAFLVDLSNKHLVEIDSDQIRLHMIVHSKLKPGIVQQSYEQNFYS